MAFYTNDGWKQMELEFKASKEAKAFEKSLSDKEVSEIYGFLTGEYKSIDAMRDSITHFKLQKILLNQDVKIPSRDLEFEALCNTYRK